MMQFRALFLCSTFLFSISLPILRAEDPPKWKQEFDETYTLKEGEFAKVIPKAKQPESRREFVREQLKRDLGPTVEITEKGIDSNSNRSFIFEVDADGKRIRNWETGTTTTVQRGKPNRDIGVEFNWMLIKYLFRADRYECVFEPIRHEDSYMDCPDFIVRVGAAREKLVAAVEKELQQYGAKFQVVLVKREREVFVASGEFKSKPNKWRKENQVDVFTDEELINKKEFNVKGPDRLFAQRGTIADFLESLHQEFQVDFVWHDGKPPVKDQFEWGYHWEEGRIRSPIGSVTALEQITEQTGLKFTKEKREVPTIVVKPR